MDKETFDLISAISQWDYASVSIEGVPCDTLIFITYPHKIRVECNYRKSKSLVYNPELRDSTYFYSNNLNFLTIKELFQKYIPDKYEKMAL